MLHVLAIKLGKKFLHLGPKLSLRDHPLVISHILHYNSHIKFNSLNVYGISDEFKLQEITKIKSKKYIINR